MPQLSQRYNAAHEEFLPFSRLPKELRLQIWEIVPIILDRVVRLKLFDDGSLRSCSPPPAMFLVCRESSEVASSFYTRHFGTILAPPKTWFNYELDTLYLDNFDVENYLWGLHADAIRVKHLAICSEIEYRKLLGNTNFSLFDYLEDDIRDILKVFRNLRELTLVPKQYIEEADSEICLKAPWILSSQERDEYYEWKEEDKDCYRRWTDFIDQGTRLIKLKSLQDDDELEYDPDENRIRGLKFSLQLRILKTPGNWRARLAALEQDIIAHQQQPWTIPKTINFRFATDRKGALLIDGWVRKEDERDAGDSRDEDNMWKWLSLSSRSKDSRR